MGLVGVDRSRGDDAYLFDLGSALGVGEAVKGGVKPGNDLGCLTEGDEHERGRGVGREDTLKPSTLRSDMMGMAMRDFFSPAFCRTNAHDYNVVPAFSLGWSCNSLRNLLHSSQTQGYWIRSYRSEQVLIIPAMLESDRLLDRLGKSPTVAFSLE